MCQQIIQFCSGSTKPLLFAGSFLLFLSALAVGYLGCSTNALFQDIDLSVAQSKSLAYYLQLAAAAYLTLITLLASFAAYYDQKHSIRALSLVTSINFVLAAGAIFLVPTGTEVGRLFSDRLKEARGLYNFTDKYQAPTQITAASNLTAAVVALASTTTGESQSTSGASSQPLTSAEATKIWDKLQARGCCGLVNATEEWRPDIPKSCCAQAPDSGSNNTAEKVTCKSVDSDHQKPCIELIGGTSLSLIMLLALIALVNLYLATVTGISAYRHFHYNEASQSAYT